MRTSARFVVLIGLFFIHGLEVFAEDDKLIEESQPVTPVIERSSHHHHIASYHHHHEDPTYQGFWKKKFVWRPRWVKTWQEKKIYLAVWKRMWGPSIVNEWVPVPKPPPGWVKHQHGNYVVKGRI